MNQESEKYNELVGLGSSCIDFSDAQTKYCSFAIFAEMVSITDVGIFFLYDAVSSFVTPPITACLASNSSRNAPSFHALNVQLPSRDEFSISAATPHIS